MRKKKRTRAGRLAAAFHRAPEREAPLRERGVVVPFEDRIARLRAALEGGRIGERIVRALPASIEPRVFVDGAIAEVQRSPSLLDCELGSIVGAVLEAAELGLEFGARQHVHLVAHETDGGRKRASCVVGYRGMVWLAHGSGVVADVNAQIVRRGDVFRVTLGTDPSIEHVPKWSTDVDPDGKDVVAAYCVVGFKGGGRQVELLNRSQLDRLRELAGGTADDSAWTLDFAGMARKSVVRSAMRLVPLGDRAARASIAPAPTPAPAPAEQPPEPPAATEPRPSGAIAALSERLTADQRAAVRAVVGRSLAGSGRRGARAARPNARAGQGGRAKRRAKVRR